jgi:hypothetical protein
LQPGAQLSQGASTLGFSGWFRLHPIGQNLNDGFSLQQRDEARLLKMLVGRQCMCDPRLPHDLE